MPKETGDVPSPTTSLLPAPGPQCAEERLIALALTARWMTLTGRRLDSATPLLHDLPAYELIDFWADDHLVPVRPASRERGTHEPDRLRLHAA
ncbi:hypothetical protein [Actinoallomurus iriomotensis]|uniref:hypothetical protein n=1 Tax=Actinoallomurus iriomotensis TaxID=478107 RepID=UPI00255435B0|nr:hypothetical protein [Actinoallomurus iriomotensis]